MSPTKTTLSVVIPTYNEAKRLPPTIDEIVPFLETHFTWFEIVVVDDNSPDGTIPYSQARAAADSRIRLLVQPRRLGKGAAVRRGCMEAKGELVLFMDADHATPIEEVLSFVQLAAAHNADVVAGVRTYQEGESKWRRILGMVAQIMSHLLVFEKPVFDSQCGFKLFTSSSVQKIMPLCRVDGGMIDVEIFSIIHRLGLICTYQPIRWFNKPGSRINILKCIIQDSLELVKIRLRRTAGIYSRPIPAELQPWNR
jgi:dolichyl-phosphate beta-glucosyltransferase